LHSVNPDVAEAKPDDGRLHAGQPVGHGREDRGATRRCGGLADEAAGVRRLGGKERLCPGGEPDGNIPALPDPQSDPETGEVSRMDDRADGRVVVAVDDECRSRRDVNPAEPRTLN
ncbi:MAG: hypothetical protein ACK559_35170, partial [bacterium]